MKFDAIIVGGSYAGLSAAMALGRSLRNVLVIDGGEPCNRYTPHSHNFITQDGQTPAAISALAKEQVLKYPTVTFVTDKAIKAEQKDQCFEIRTESGKCFLGKKVILATGIVDQMRPIPGFEECWGNTIIHCPYCHGYEVRNEKIGILSNSEASYEFARLINNWSKDIRILTDGDCEIPEENLEKLRYKKFPVVEGAIEAFIHEEGKLQKVLFKDGSELELTAIFVRVPFKFATDLHEQLGCELNDHGHIRVNDLQQTSVPGVYAAGDATTGFRSVASATATGNKAGALVNHELIHEEDI